MAIDITIPSPGESITEVTLGKWHRRAGEWVNKDEPLVEIESDKVTFDIAAPEAGLLDVLPLAQSGTEMKVGQKIGTIDPKGKPLASVDGAGVSPPPSADHVARSATRVEAATESAVRQAEDLARATPVARKIAAEKGIDLAKVQGTGPSGRVRKSDVLAAKPAERRAGPPAGPAGPPVRVVPPIVAVSAV